MGGYHKIAMDLVAGTIVGLFIGLSLDKWLITNPLWLIVCTIIGFIAGFRNIIKKTEDDTPS